MHDFKLVHYDTHGFIDIILSNLLRISLLTILFACVIILITFVIFDTTSKEDFIIICISFIFSFIVTSSITFIVHHNEKEKYNLQYEAKVKVIEYHNTEIADDRANDVAKNNYMIVQMNDKKQKIYFDNTSDKGKDNQYRIEMNDNIKKGDTIKVIVHAYKKTTYDIKPHIGKVDYLNDLKNSNLDQNKYYIEIKK